MVLENEPIAEELERRAAAEEEFFKRKAYNTAIPAVRNSTFRITSVRPHSSAHQARPGRSKPALLGRPVEDDLTAPLSLSCRLPSCPPLLVRRRRGGGLISLPPAAPPTTQGADVSKGKNKIAGIGKGIGLTIDEFLARQRDKGAAGGAAAAAGGGGA